ncbi:MAG TPA: hypothetical protein VGD53_15460 [Actinoallomurus sp.]|jgi:hypothetical protein
MNVFDTLTDRLAVLIPDLRSEYPEWTIHRATSGRWLAIRGNTCIRAHNATELRDRVRRHLAEIAEDIAGDSA